MIKQEIIEGLESLSDWVMRTSNANASYQEDLKVIDDVLEILIDLDKVVIFENINDVALKIVGLAIEKSTTTKHAVFADFQGHINHLSIRVYKDGYEKGKTLHLDNSIRLVPNQYHSEEELLKQLIEAYKVIASLE